MKQDIATGNLVENNDVFADIVNVNLFDGEQMITAQDLESVPVNGSYKDLDGTLHRLMRDILKRVRTLHGCIAMLGCENQADINRIMPVRDMGYAYAAYMKQILDIVAENKRQDHPAYTRVLHEDQKLIPVGTFILYFGEEPWETPLSLMDILEIPEEDRDVWKGLVNDHKIRVIHMVGQPEEIRKKYQSDFKVVADYLACYKDGERLRRFLRSDDRKLVHVEQVLDMLQALSSDARFRKIKEKYIECEEKEEHDRMCLLLDMCEEDGMAKGMSKGSDLKLISQVCRKLQKGKEPDEIAEDLEEDIETVEQICEAVREALPEYDAEAVYEILQLQKA